MKFSKFIFDSLITFCSSASCSLNLTGIYRLQINKMFRVPTLLKLADCFVERGGVELYHKTRASLFNFKKWHNNNCIFRVNGNLFYIQAVCDHIVTSSLIDRMWHLKDD